MSGKPLSGQEMTQRLSEHPQIRQRIELLLSVIEAEGGSLRRADDAEERLIEEIRQLGRDVAEPANACALLAKAQESVRESLLAAVAKSHH